MDSYSFRITYSATSLHNILELTQLSFIIAVHQHGNPTLTLWV